ncbi:MAG: transporter substrate-binding domain-containing protein [Fibrobacterales bacterium]
MILLYSQPVAKNKKVLVNAWGENWEPFWIKNEKGYFGIDLELLQEVVDLAGFELQYTKHSVPWKRHLHSLKTGTIDLATSASKTKEREVYAYFTIPYRHERVGLYFRNDDVNKYEIQKIEDLLNYPNLKVGIESGVYYGRRIDSLLNTIKHRVEAITDENDSNRKKLIYKRIDCYLGYPTSEIAYKDTSDIVELHTMPLITTGDIHIMLSKKNNTSEEFNALNNALKEIMTNGTYDRIVKKYSEKYGVAIW